MREGRQGKALKTQFELSLQTFIIIHKQQRDRPSVHNNKGPIKLENVLRFQNLAKLSYFSEL